MGAGGSLWDEGGGDAGKADSFSASIEKKYQCFIRQYFINHQVILLDYLTFSPRPVSGLGDTEHKNKGMMRDFNVRTAIVSCIVAMDVFSSVNFY